MLKVKFCEEDSRPRMFWFENEQGEDVTDVFCMGDIKKEYKKMKKLGIEIINENDIKEWL